MTVGNGTDYFAEVASGTTIYQGQGAFTQVLNVTSENEGGNANEFSLQLNSNAFTTNACNGLSGCIGWAQFLYTNPYYPLTGGSEPYGAAFIQYWLIPTNGQGLTCPSGPWQSSSGGCVYNSPVACIPSCDATTDLTIASLPLMTLTGMPGTAGNDEVMLSVGSTLYSVSNLISNPDMGLAGNWDTAEFNVFGDGGGSYATFNTGATVTVTISVNNGTTNAPSCAQTSPSGAATAETNSLTLVSPCCPISGASPGIAFLESSASPLPTEKCSASALGWLPAVLWILQHN